MFKKFINYKIINYVYFKMLYMFWNNYFYQLNHKFKIIAITEIFYLIFLKKNKRILLITKFINL
jgi:hypothetical protein